MPSSFSRKLRRFALWISFDLFLVGALLVFTAWADTSSSLRHPQAAGCYCSCAQSKTSAGCAKMCELPKYASRWWAVTCHKPRSNSTVDNPGAGPRVPHPPRAERAAL